MAWTTSACLRARPSLTNLAIARLKPLRYHLAARHRSVLRTRPAVSLSLSVLALGAAAPLLPTTFLTAILLTAGIGLAVLGAGANLAVAVRSTRRQAEAFPPVAAPPAPAAAAEAPSSIPKLARIPRPVVAAPSHDWADLMARINHELRTPLNAVIGFSEIMTLEMFGPVGSERYRDYARHIRDSAGDLLKSAEDTLALTALLTDPRTAEPPAASTLDHAVGDAWAFLERKAAARDITFQVRTPPELEVLCDPRALRQILINMLTEALTRAAHGSCISLLAVSDGELVEIVVSAGGAQAGAVPRTGSLAVSLARMLLEIQGSSLLEIETPGAGWSAVTVLDRAVQPDFFAGLQAGQPTYIAAMAV